MKQPGIPNTIIVGAGIAGLATAIRLAARGHRVRVYEQQSYPGGKLSFFAQDGFSFDRGPSLFTQPNLVKELFDSAGVTMEEYFQYETVPYSCRYQWEDGTTFLASTHTDTLITEMAATFNVPDAAIRNYLNEAEKLYNDVGKIFLDYSLHSWRTWLHQRTLKALGSVKYRHLQQTLNEVNEHFFYNPKLVQLFNRYATYNGSNPYQAPGMLQLIPHLEHRLGTYYPKGGMIAITQALHQLATRLGVEFHFNSPVQALLKNGKTIKGVKVNGREEWADAVVCNVDVVPVYRHLLQDEATAQSLLKQERSSSALIFYWGINRSFPDLKLHNIFFTEDYKAEFDHLFVSKKPYADPTVYINITAKMEAGMAPDGMENWFVMVNMPADVGQDWQGLRASIKAQVVAKLSRMLGTDIEACIVTEAVMDPVEIAQRTGSFGGSLYGTSSNSKLAAFWRHPNKAKHLDQLYFCGGSVHPGGGIPLCLHSAALVEKEMWHG